MLGRYKPLWGKKPQLKSSYDAVIIGGGLHGLATAYFLARDHGLTDVAVLEKRFIGFGGAGRNTAIVRANQRTQQNVPLYKEGLELWPILTKELDYNLMFFNPEPDAQRGRHELGPHECRHCSVSRGRKPFDRCQAVQGAGAGAEHITGHHISDSWRHVSSAGRHRAP